MQLRHVYGDHHKQDPGERDPLFWPIKVWFSDLNKMLNFRDRHQLTETINELCRIKNEIKSDSEKYNIKRAAQIKAMEDEMLVNKL